jgi:transcriptional regulator NrdR family protein
MQCPECGSSQIGTYRSCHDTVETITRQRRCRVCKHKFHTVELELPPNAVKFKQTYTEEGKVKVVMQRSVKHSYVKFS